MCTYIHMNLNYTIVGKKGILSSYACVINVVVVCWILHVFDDNENAEALPLNISS